MKTNARAVYAVGIIISGLLTTSWPAAAQTAPPLGDATIVGATTITDTGATPYSINGNVDLYPGSSITGITAIDVTGTININNTAAANAQSLDAEAYSILDSGEGMAINKTGSNLGGITLTPGVYNFTSSAQLTGTLTLNTLGNPNAVFVIQIGTTLTTATGSMVTVIGNPSDPNIFWQVGTSATIGSATVFDGNIVANTSITLDPGATLSIGTVSALNGAVTMAGGNTINLNGLGGPAPSNPLNGTYWNGNASNLWSGENWSPDATGATNETLSPEANVVFSVTGVTPTNENTDLDAPETISSLTVNDPVPVSISGTNTLTINGTGGTTGITINNGAGLTTINSNLELGGSSQVITVNNAAGLVINGDVSGTIGLTKAGIDTLTLTGANTYTGGTAINAGVLVVGSANALGGTPGGSNGPVTNGNALPAAVSILETTASTGGSTETINVNGAYTQNASGNLLLQVAGSPAPTPSINSGTAGVNYDTLLATGVASLGGALYLNFNAASVPSQGQRYVVVQSLPATGAPVVGQFSNNLTDTMGLPASFLAVTTYNDNFGNPTLDNSVIVTLLQSFTSFQGLTPNQSNVAANIDSTVNVLNNNGSLATPTGVNADFFNNIVTGLNLASYSGSLGAALDQLSPQRFEILRNVAFDNYALDVQNLDDELARERTGAGGLDTSGFVFNPLSAVRTDFKKFR